jgi:curli biogenesis system outer membrane secretion channel CsgG/ribosomal protein S27AE
VTVKAARTGALLAFFSGLLCLAIGCASRGESASRDKLTSNVGKYEAAPQTGGEKPRVGVPPFKVQTAGGIRNTNNLPNLAADQMTTLLDQTSRFNVIERAQVEQLLDEQNLEGIVRPDQMAKAGQVLGVDYLLIGKVTNFRVKQDRTNSGVNLGGIGGMVGGGKFGAGNSGFDTSKQIITTECGVDIRLVDPTTGRIAASQSGEFKRTDSAGALGVSVLGVGAKSGAEVTIEEDDAGKILRLAFDDALRKMLPKVDQELANRGKSGAHASRPAKAPARAAVEPADAGGNDNAADTTAPATKAPANGATGGAPAAANKFCPNCGEKVASTAKFCPKCGAKIE